MIFNDQITDSSQLHDLYGTPSLLAQNKVIDHLDAHCQEFIKQVPYLVLATADKDGNCDSSPRGDAAGFIYVLNDQYLVIPERPGNKRLDSLHNILENPQVSMLLIIPGLKETLRIRGKAIITKDPEILTKMSVNGKLPLLGIAVEVQEAYIHCGKAFLRSQLWKPETWPASEGLPNAAKILAAHSNLPDKGEAKITLSLKEGYAKRLY